jgi:chorismate mutase/prephenate dehydratase
MAEMSVGDSVVGELREQISAVDDDLVAVVNRRLELARRIFEHKEANGIPIVDPGREAAIVARLVGENRGPLSDDGVADLVRYVLGLTKRELGRG